MVKALHKAGIEVILDVVFNHTGEGNHLGPTISFKGLDNDAYYHPRTRPTGSTTWTTPAAATRSTRNHPVVDEVHRRLPAVLGRGDARRRLPLRRGLDPARAAPDGAPLDVPAGRSGSIELSETLADTKVIAEAWDAAGLYQVGQLPGLRAGRSGTAASATTSGASSRATPGSSARSRRGIAGSADIYQAQRPSCRSTASTSSPCHDGFTLNDLVSLQREAQRGQRRGQPRRHRRQPELELRRRGPDRRPGDRGAARAADQELRRHPAALAGRADVPGRRRDRAAPSAATTTPTARTTRSAGSTGTSPRRTPTCSASSSGMIALPHARTRPCAGASSSPARSNRRGLPDIAWHGCELDQPGLGRPELARARLHARPGVEPPSPTCT